MCKDNNPPLLPAERCVICECTLDGVGGRRIIAQKLRGVCLTAQYRGGGNPDYPERSIPLGDGSGYYLLVWGEPSKWNDAAMERARQDYLAHRRPWLCQKCAERVCRECGAPINYPMGSDALSDNGCSSHIPIFGIDPGCMNKACKKYREWAL